MAKKVTVKRIDKALNGARNIFNHLDWFGTKQTDNEEEVEEIREIIRLLHDMRGEVKQRSGDNHLCSKALKKDRRKIIKNLG